MKRLYCVLSQSRARGFSSRCRKGCKAGFVLGVGAWKEVESRQEDDEGCWLKTFRKIMSPYDPQIKLALITATVTTSFETAQTELEEPLLQLGQVEETNRSVGCGDGSCNCIYHKLNCSYQCISHLPSKRLQRIF